MVWRGPSTVYPDSANVLRNLAPMMWQWQALGDLWYCQTAVSHPLVASVAQMPSGRPDQRLKHGRQAELFPRSPDASALGVVDYARLAPPARSVAIVARRALVAVVRDLCGRRRHLRLPCFLSGCPATGIAPAELMLTEPRRVVLELCTTRRGVRMRFERHHARVSRLSPNLSSPHLGMSHMRIWSVFVSLRVAAGEFLTAMSPAGAVGPGT